MKVYLVYKNYSGQYPFLLHICITASQATQVLSNIAFDEAKRYPVTISYSNEVSSPFDIWSIHEKDVMMAPESAANGHTGSIR